MQKEELYRILENSSLLNEDTVEEMKKLTEDFPWFSLGWVLYLKNLKQIDSPEYGSVLKKVAVRVSNRKLLYEYLNSNNNSWVRDIELDSSYSILNEKQGKPLGDSLIDKFLSSNPGVIRRNPLEENSTENDNTRDIIEKSLTEDEELITETLANIYVQQKNYEKAVNAYQKLSLKYPEKSVYFATRIKEIEDLKNNN